MTLQSMTGFSRSQGTHESGSWVWELRSVNNKGLDVRLRLPPGFDSIELPCRKLLMRHFARGSIQANLQFSRNGQAVTPTLNEAALEAILSVVEPLRQRLDAPPPTIEGLLSLKGVVELQEQEFDEAAVAHRNQAIMDSLNAALEELETARRSEGAAITGVLRDQIGQIETLVAQVAADPSRTKEAIRQRLEQQIAPLIQDVGALDPQRLHQEAAILATKADLQEELDRLDAHVAAAKELLAGNGPVGRKLDFLAQEFNRECNTLCSKSNAPSVTACGLELKILVDQLREQTQNLE